MGPFPEGRTRMRSPRHAFTLIELLVVVTIIMLLAGMVIAMSGTVVERARRVSCGSRLRALTMSTIAWSTDHEGLLPEGGRFNNGAVGQWDTEAQLLEVASYEEVDGTKKGNGAKPARCPGTPNGILYLFFPGQAADYPQALSKLIRVAQRAGVPGNQPAMWADPCYLNNATNTGNFGNGCGHKKEWTSATTGIPYGGNVTMGDGSLAWAPYKSASSAEVSYFVNGASIGSNRAIPTNAVILSIDNLGNLDMAPGWKVCIGKIGTYGSLAAAGF